MARAHSRDLENLIAASGWGIFDPATITIYAADGTTPATLYSGATGGGTVSQPVTTTAGAGLPDFYMDPGDYVRRGTTASGKTVPNHSFTVLDPAPETGGGGSTEGPLTWTDVPGLNANVEQPDGLGDGTEHAAYAVTSFAVILRGALFVAADVAGGGTVFTLPVGARPAGRRRRVVSSPANHRPLYINADGTVTTPGGLFGGDVISFDGMVIPLP
jgi:hypothetical protein